MRTLNTLLLGMAIVLGTSGFVEAQTKIAHINVQNLVNEMPETKAAQAEIKKLEQAYRADLEASAKELQNLYEKYQNESAVQTQEENEKRAEEVQQMELNIRQAEQMAGQELQKRQVELLEPIFKKANDAIVRVAREQGFHYVLDESAGQGVILADGVDLMPDVRRVLGF